MHLCARPGCTNAVQNNTLLCRTDWATVDYATKAAVSRTWSDYQRQPSFVTLQVWETASAAAVRQAQAAATEVAAAPRHPATTAILLDPLAAPDPQPDAEDEDEDEDEEDDEEDEEQSA